MMPGPEVADPVAARAIAERQELMRQCAARVLDNHACGRRFADALTLDWAKTVIATTPVLLGHLTQGVPA